ncbi:MAG: PP2C family serine/threonine-protein phosphatase [Tateyamaria sp.]|jgi:serine/threonine protein phosphatase PrpC|uniref:PP2C family serine/threonine-protein phosphatase n=1 Tax=Tateyamaria sp. TaxID=1929288 RepID=UPI0032DDEB07
MHFEVLQVVSINGHADKPNDDRCGSIANLAWVVDGATDLSEPGLLGSQGGASWLASAASSTFAISEATDIQQTCQAAFSRIEAQFEAQRTREVSNPWEMPKAAFAVALLKDDVLWVAWAADCPILLISNDNNVWCTDEPDSSAEMAEARALGAGVGTDPVLTGEVLENRRIDRSRENHFALSPNANSSTLATHYAHFNISIGDEVILMSDGFASIVTDYRKYTAQEMVEVIKSKGLGTIVEEIRVIERKDSACRQFPRFKVSDDATAVWVRISG